MMRKKLMKMLLFAVVAMTAMADVVPMRDTSYPRYIYHYHAVPQSVFNAWREHRKLVNAESMDLDWHTWLKERENTAWEKCKKAVRTVLKKYAFEITSIVLIVCFTVFVVFLRHRRYKVAILCFLFGVVVFIGVLFFGTKWSNRFRVLNSEIVITETVNVEPNDGESYDQYQTRVFRKDHGLCEVCGAGFEHWYDMGRHWGCRNCWEEERAAKRKNEWIKTDEGTGN